LLSSLADQQVVRNWGRTGSDAEKGIERSMPRPAAIEAEHELVEVVLEVCLSQSVVEAQAPSA
jgi:predicted DNA-binding WGR domain protein